MLPYHLHSYIQFKEDGGVKLNSTSPAYVFFLDEKAYQLYLQNKDFEYYGGEFDQFPVTAPAPSADKWHLVIQQKDGSQDLAVSMQLINGKKIHYQQDSLKEEKQREIQQQQTREEIHLSDEQKKEALKEIRKLIKELNDENIIMNLRQLRVMIHNQEIDKINQQIEQSNKKLASIQEKEINVGGKTKTVKEYSTAVETTGSENVFVLILQGCRKMVQRQELRALVKICHSENTAASAAKRLHRWLSTQRSDILHEAGIQSAASAVYPKLYEYLRSHYKAKQE